MTAMRLLVAALALGLVAGCSHDKKEAAKPGPAASQTASAGEAQAPAQTSGGLVFGGPQGGRFIVPPEAKAGGAPDVNTVPTTAPKPTSTKEERQEALVGLIADRQNARHTDQVARTMPVAVRPLSDQPAPQAQLQAAAARVPTPPPPRPADADGAASDAAPAVPPAPTPRSVATMIGPRLAPSSSLRPSTDDDDDSADSGAVSIGVGSGFRSLAEFDSTVYGPSHLAAELQLPSGNLTVGERRELSDAALKQTQTKAVVRVIGHGADPKTARDKAISVSRELERLGVANDQIFVGFEVSNGPTQVYLHY